MTKDISKLIEAVNRVGIQNVSLLARMTGMPTETIRYTMKKRFPSMGLNIRTPLNLAVMGLQRYFVSFKFSENAASSAPTILKALNSSAFLTYKCEAPIERQYLTLFSVPVAVEDEFGGFLNSLVEERVLEDVSSEALEWSRQPELKSKYYNFGTGKWSVEWEKLRKSAEAPPAPIRGQEPAPSPEIDSTDTLIIKELEIDSWRNIAEIARKLGLNERTVRWHYRKHVLDVARSSYVSWNPVTKERISEAVGFVHEFHNVSKEKLAGLRYLFNNFPFSWFEAGGKDGYYQVHSALPADYFMESMRFLNSGISEITKDWKTWTVDLSTIHPWSIPYQNFSDKKGWFFNRESALKAVLMPQELKIK